MRYIKRYSDPSEFLKLLPNHQIINGEVYVNGNVDIKGKGWNSIPVKFSKVSGYINVSDNNLNSFEFLPEDCGGNYIISNNPGIKGKFGEIYKLMSIKSGHIKGIYQPIFNSFVSKCLEYGSWHDGESNDVAIEDAWAETKIEKYKQHEDSLVYGMPELLNLDDRFILTDFFDIKSDNWIPELVEILLSKLESNELIYLKLLCYLIKDDFDEQIKKIVVDKYDLSEIYSNIDRIENMSDLDIENLSHLMHKKFIRTEEIKERDDSYDLFIFIAKDKFVKKGRHYDRTLEIENLLK